MRLEPNDPLTPWCLVRDLETGAHIADVVMADEAAEAVRVLLRNGRGETYPERDPDRPGEIRPAQRLLERRIRIELGPALPARSRDQIVALFEARQNGRRMRCA